MVEHTAPNSGDPGKQYHDPTLKGYRFSKDLHKHREFLPYLKIIETGPNNTVIDLTTCRQTGKRNKPEE